MYIYTMPARRFNRRRNYNRRRRPAWYNKKYSAKDLAIKALKNVHYIKGLVNSEMFYKDNDFQLGSQTNAIFNLVDIDQGDYPYQRTGNSILLRSILLNGYAQINSNVTAATRYTICLIKDKQQISDTTPALTDIFQDPTQTFTLLNRNNAGRFSVLYRKQYSLLPATAGQTVHNHKIYKKFRLHVRFNGTGVSDTQKNGIYLVILTSEGSNYPTIRFNARTGYHDN